MQCLIDKYQLVPHPEGGFYREVYRSEQRVKSPVTFQSRDAVTHIYFLLMRGQVSRFHKVLHDEIWNLYEGAPLRLIVTDGEKVEENLIGATCDAYFYVVSGGMFQAAESTGDYSLVGCTVAPGFDFADFSFLADEADVLARFEGNFTEYKRFV